MPDTFNLDPADVMYKITTATKAIIPVHLFGQCAEMDEIRQIATAARGIPIIEDACQAIGAEYTGQRAGSIGTMGCFSFYPTKNLGGFGDGGLITTNDGELAAKLRVLRDHGQQPRYYHHFVGLNSRLDALQAAVLSVKLPQLDDWAAAPRAARGAVCDGVCAPRAWRTDRRADGGRRLPRTCGTSTRCACTDGRRDALQKYLAERKIGSAIYYPVPLHLQKCFAPLGYERRQLAGDRAGVPRSAVAARVSGD